MPLRPASLAQRWSTYDLPVLPFLAPRVFQPWPLTRGGQRNYSTTQPAERSDDEQERLAPATVLEGWNPSEGGEGVSRVQSHDGLEYAPILPTRSPRKRGSNKQSTAKGSARFRDPKLIHKDVPSSRILGSLPGNLQANWVPQHWLKPPKKSGTTEDVFTFFRYLDALRRKEEYRNHRSLPNTRPSYQRHGQRAPDPATAYMDCRQGKQVLPQIWWLPRGLETEEHRKLLDSLLSEPTSVDLCRRWKELSHEQQNLLWPRFMRTTSGESPHQLLKLLAGTYETPYPPATYVSGFLDYLIFHYLDDLEPSIGTGKDALVLYRTVTKLLGKGPADYVSLSQHSVYLLSHHLPTLKLVAELYKMLEDMNHPLTADTLTQFAASLAKAGETWEELTYKILQHIGDLGTDFNSEAVQSLCTTILYHSSYNNGTSHSEKFEYMLNSGLTPNIIIYNVLLLKHLRGGDTAASWKIFHMMEETGPEPDAYTYSTMLNDAKRRLDTTAVNDLLAAVKRKGIRHSYVVADALHTTMLLSERRRGREAYEAEMEGRNIIRPDRTSFEMMLPYYCQYFKFEPLAHLLPGLSERYPQYMALDKKEALDIDEIDLIRAAKVDNPTSSVLVIMITALLREYEDENTPKWFYQHLQKLTQVRDPFILELANRREGHYMVHMYNLVLMALGRHASNIPLCLQILGEMSKARPKVEYDVKGNAKDPNRDVEFLIPKPTSGTWGVLANMFMNHRQPRAADKVINMMRERGIQPENVTWNIMLQGYTKLKDTQMVIEIMDRRAREGFPSDRMTIRQLKRVDDQRSLIEGLRRTEMERLEEELDERDRKAAPRQGNAEQAELELKVEEEFVVRDMERRFSVRKTGRKDAEPGPLWYKREKEVEPPSTYLIDDRKF